MDLFVKPIECTTPRVEPTVIYGLWVIITCQRIFTDRNKCPILVQDADSGGRKVCLCGSRGTWDLSVLPAEFAMNLNPSKK